MTSFLLALQFLTRIPVPFAISASDRQIARSVLFYPLVGLIVGLFLSLAVFAFDPFPALLRTVLLLTLWVALTGGLHLDGLADCADAWVGGFGDRDKTLRIMKDPAAGPAAIVALFLTLSLKGAALHSLPAAQAASVLVAVPLLARTTILILMLSAPYVSRHGLAETMMKHLPAKECKVLVAAVVAVCLAWLGWLPMLLAIGAVVWIRALAMQRIGGMTGDVYGASVECVEVAVLIGVAANV